MTTKKERCEYCGEIYECSTTTEADVCMCFACEELAAEQQRLNDRIYGGAQ